MVQEVGPFHILLHLAQSALNTVSLNGVILSILALPGQSNPHPPSSTEVLQFLLLHSSAETQAMKDPRSSHLCLVCIQLLQTLIQLHQLLTLSYVEEKRKTFTINFNKYSYRTICKPIICYI